MPRHCVCDASKHPVELARVSELGHDPVQGRSSGCLLVTSGENFGAGSIATTCAHACLYLLCTSVGRSEGRAVPCRAVPAWANKERALPPLVHDTVGFATSIRTNARRQRPVNQITATYARRSGRNLRLLRHFDCAWATSAPHDRAS
jgi:hypothetical protein